jgi:hypothetical protein
MRDADALRGCASLEQAQNTGLATRDTAASDCRPCIYVGCPAGERGKRAGWRCRYQRHVRDEMDRSVDAHPTATRRIHRLRRCTSSCGWDRAPAAHLQRRGRSGCASFRADLASYTATSDFPELFEDYLGGLRLWQAAASFAGHSPVFRPARGPALILLHHGARDTRVPVGHE